MKVKTLVKRISGLTVLMCMLFSLTVFAGEWKKDSAGWWYQNSDGSYLRSGKYSLGGQDYVFDDSGYMAAGRWCSAGGAWYYCDESGAVQKNRWIGDYYVGADGAMAVNTWIGAYYVGADGRWVQGQSAGSTGQTAQASGGSDAAAIWEDRSRDAYVSDASFILLKAGNNYVFMQTDRNQNFYMQNRWLQAGEGAGKNSWIYSIPVNVNAETYAGNTARCNLNGSSQFTIYAATKDVLTAGGDVLFHANASGWNVDWSKAETVNVW